MIDDSVDTCELLSKNNINSLIFNSPANIDINSNCDRVSSWEEIYDYILCKI